MDGTLTTLTLLELMPKDAAKKRLQNRFLGATKLIIRLGKEINRIFKRTLLFLLKRGPPPGGLEPPTFRLTAERASQLRHGGFDVNRKEIALFKSEVD